MTAYTDVPTTSQLHQESQQIIDAIASLDAGGTIGSLTFTPPPIPAPPEPGEPIPVILSIVSVIVPPPVNPTLLAQIRTWLDQRLVDISAELTALGVAVPPIPAMESMSRGRMMPPLPQYPPMSAIGAPTPPPVIPPPTTAPTPQPKE